MDQEKQFVVISDSLNQLIANSHPAVASALSMIKEGYEYLINSVAEDLTSQIDYLAGEV